MCTLCVSWCEKYRCILQSRYNLRVRERGGRKREEERGGGRGEGSGKREGGRGRGGGKAGCWRI